LGPSRLGLPFHRHKAFAYTVEHGKKFFALMPQGSLDGKEEAIRMDLTVLPPAVTLQRHVDIFAGADVLRCVLKPGDSLIVPAYWDHLTLAIGDSLGASDQFEYISGSSPARAFWTDWCETLVPELARCKRQSDCIDRHFHVLTKQEMKEATDRAPMHQCVAPMFALYWQPRDMGQAASVLRFGRNWYVKMVKRGLDALVASEILATWAEVAEHLLGDTTLAKSLAQTAGGLSTDGGYWRAASRKDAHTKHDYLYRRLQRRLRFTDAPACELRMHLVDRGLLPERPRHDEL